MAAVAWTQEAIRWLDDIHAYIAADSPEAAARVCSGIYDKVQLLREHPRLGARYETITDREVRVLLFGHYRIAYLIKTQDRIDILGIFHAAMEIDNYLR